MLLLLPHLAHRFGAAVMTPAGRLDKIIDAMFD